MSSATDMQSIFSESLIKYQEMMKSLDYAKSLRKEILDFEEAKRGDSQFDQNDNVDDIFSKDVHMESEKSIQESENQKFSGCFGCAFNFLNVILNFINETASIPELNQFYLEDEFISKLYSENLSMFAENLRDTTRNALVKIVSKDNEASIKLLGMIENSILKSPKTSILHNSKDKDDSVPYQKLLMVFMEDLHQQYEESNRNKKESKLSESYSECLKLLMRILLSSIEYGQKSAPIASGLISNCLNKINDLVKLELPDIKLKKELSSNSPKRMQKNASSKIMKSTPIQEILKIGQLSKVEGSSSHFEHLEVLIKCLLMRTSENCRVQASEILRALVSISDNNYYKIVDQLENYMDESIKNEEVSEHFFSILSQLLNKDKIIEIVKKNQENEDLYTKMLTKLFEQITYKCEMLSYIQKKKERLGRDGLYIELNQGKALDEIIDIVSNMIQVDFLKIEFKQETYIYATIKSLLKIQKLFLLKNKSLISCEKKINKMFKEINSDSDQEKQKFILACLKLTEECDKQEITFLYENIKSIIDPVKPIPNYKMNLNKNPNHEIYLRGRMAKNPYNIKDLGNSMRDALEKI